jgi:hypothetical protein
MNPAIRNQLKHLDRSLLALLNERALLLRGVDANETVAAIDDLLRRSSGHFPPQELRDAFLAIERGSRALAGDDERGSSK